MAIVFNCYDAVAYLIKLGANIDSRRERDGKTPLINAITRNRETIAALLIEKDADITTPGRDGSTPIYHAVKMGQNEVVQKLLDKEVSANFKDISGRTLLHIACLNGYYKIAEILIKNIQDVNVLDNTDKSALYYASRYGHKKVADLLIAHGAKPKEGIENNFGKSSFLTDKVDKGDAVAWYLNNRGWAVKTQNHLLVFDSEEFGVKRPDEPLLANGFLSPYEIADQNIIAIYTAYHGEIGEPAYIHTIEDSVKNIRYIHNKLDNWRGSEKTIYMEAREEKKIDDLWIAAITIQEEMPVLGYLCKVDNVNIFYTGFRPVNIEKYKKEIDFLARATGDIDMAFFSVAERGEENSELLYLIDKLHPKAIYPLDPDRREYLFPEVKDLMKLQKVDVQVFCAENPGDHFYYSKLHNK
jgi:hypothetical protein